MDTDENKTDIGPELLELKVQSLNFRDISSHLHEDLNHTPSCDLSEIVTLDPKSCDKRHFCRQRLCFHIFHIPTTCVYCRGSL